MTTLTRSDPFSEFRTAMDRLFDEAFSRAWQAWPHESARSFPVEIYETPESVEIRAALPGVRPEDVNISMVRDVLTIKASHPAQEEAGERRYYARELHYGEYQRTFALPVSVDVDKAEARYENGLLLLSLPKSEAMRPKQIPISVGNGSQLKA